MSRHPLDRQTASSQPRPTLFDPVAQGERPSPATRDLQRRARTKGTERLKHFARIERTGTED